MNMIKNKYTPGQRVGHITYLNDTVNPKTGYRMITVQCDCGRIYTTQPGTMKRENPMCYVCANKIKAQKRIRLDLIGKTIGGWRVLRLAKNINGCNYFECECQRCHNTSLKDSSQILYSKGNGLCENCKPDFNFEIHGDYAVGTLPSGDKFIIDTEDIEKVSQYYWYKKTGQNYIVCNVKGHPKYRLHRFVMGLPPIDEAENDYVVDHINRNPMDCRKSNLRVATQHQNCFNKSLRSNNRIGYTGVQKDKKRYGAFIFLNGKETTLGYSDDPKKCAAMYNYASLLVFKQFIGQRNEAETLTDEEKRRIENKVTPLMEAANQVTQEVAF